MRATFLNEDGEEVNEYGNPVSGDSMPYCQLPGCGCPESRLCMARKGCDSKYEGELLPIID